MKYYLIDENKVRLYYQNKIVVNYIQKNSFVLYGVQYTVNDNLFVESAQLISKNAYAITTEGLVKLKLSNYSVDRFPAKFDTSKREIGRFCYDYICLGKIPSKDTLKFTAKDIKYYNRLEKKIYSPEKLKAVVKEKNGIIYIELPFTDEESYDVGPMIGNKLFSLYYVEEYHIRSTVKIMKGTCFYTNETYIGGSDKRVVHSRRKLYELCYD